MKTLLSIALLLLTCGITMAEDAPVYTYTCEIPKGLKKETVLHYNSGRKERADAHEIYRSYHRQGWLLMVEHYLKTGTMRYIGREDIQEMGIHTMSRDLGVAEAKVLLLKLELVMTPEEITRGLKSEVASLHKKKAAEEKSATDEAIDQLLDSAEKESGEQPTKTDE